MIADEASVSRGAMMHHFPSRSAVMNAVVGYLHVRRLNEYRALMTGIESPDENLTRKTIRTSVENAWKYVNLPSFVAYQELLALPERIRSWPRQSARWSRISSGNFLKDRAHGLSRIGSR
jgi:AcrR family transcriptional regulator